ELMRYILADHARRHNALKRGGGEARIVFEDVQEVFSQPALDFSVLDDVLSRLERVDPQLARIVELRFFGGLTVHETAEVLNVSPNKITRDWQLARAWRYREMQ